MSDKRITCGACGSTNAANAVVCATCGALLAAYATPAGADDEPGPPAVPTALTPSSPPMPATTSLPTPGADDLPEPARELPAPASFSSEPTIVPVSEVPDPVTSAASPGSAVASEPLGADTPAATGTTATVDPEPAITIADDPPQAFETDAPHSWTTPWEPPQTRRARVTIGGRSGQLPSTGLPRINRLDGWGARQMLNTGIGLLLGSCLFLSFSATVNGGGCFFSLAFIVGIIGVVLTVSAARTLYGHSGE